MKYRVRMDMSFDYESDALTLMATGKSLAPKVAVVRSGGSPAENSFCEIQLCRHDEGLPCTLVERVEVTGGVA